MSSTPNNAIPYVPENTIDPAAGLNLSLQAIDALLQLSVVSVGDTTPPAAPAEGGRYIVGPGASGDWANQSGKLATWTGGVWEFRTAWYAVTGGELWVFDGLGWTNAASDVGTAAARDAIGAGDVYARGGILGTVGQSGGVPTGAIIERGSNSDGEYAKFADGTLIQTITRLILSYYDSDVVASTVYSFPIPFISTGYSLSYILRSSSEGSSAGSYTSSSSVSRSDVGGASVRKTLTFAPLWVYRCPGASSSFLAGDELYADVLTIGRWY